MKYDQIPDDATIEKAAEALRANQFEVTIVDTGTDAAQKVFELMPEGADVQVNTSITLETIGVMEKIDKSGKYNSHRAKTMALDMQKDEAEIRTLRSVADYALGSAHAVTHDGKIMIASNSGSNLPSYSYSAKTVIFVIGAQKIVDTMDDGMKRIYDYILPLETVRARKAYGLPDTWESFPSKILLFNREPQAGRTHVILVKEALGY